MSCYSSWQKDESLYDFIQMADSWRQEVKQQLLRYGGEEKGQVIFNEYRVTVWVDKNILEIDRGERT